jgi:hypothetical protein
MNMPEFYPLRLLWVIWTAYSHARKGGLAYVASDCAGVPDIAVFIGLGRDAHVVKDAAMEVCSNETESSVS